MVPKLPLIPAAIDAAMASARAQSPAGKPSSFAVAAAAPKMPSVDVGCHPRS